MVVLLMFQKQSIYNPLYFITTLLARLQGEKTLTSKLDDTDKKILSLLSQDPEVSQAELSKQLKISQPAVSARIRKLEEKGVLARIVGTDVKRAQLFLANLHVATNHVEQFLKSLDGCPLYLNSFLTSGKNNLTVLLVGENIRSIMSCVDSHLRQNPLVKDTEFDLIITPVRPFIVPIRPSMDKKKTTPCSADCGSCTLYASDRCLGCPATVYYKGELL
jgi:DNA-binding Lrp family transcriptional regulator